MAGRGSIWIDRYTLAVWLSQLTKREQGIGDSMMKPAVFIGVVLIVLSIFSFAYQGITYTTREKVIDIGPIEATAEKQKTIPLPPIFGAIALIGGIALVIIGNKN
jgi:hypothetical protein